MEQVNQTLQEANTFLDGFLTFIEVLLAYIVPIALIVLVILIFCKVFSKFANYLVSVSESIAKAIVGLANGIKCLESKKSKIITPIVTVVYIALVITYLVFKYSE